MVAFTFDPLYFSIVVFLSAMVPGLAVGWPLLKKTGLSALEKAVISFFIGLVAVPSLLFLEVILGIKFSLFMVVLDMFIVCAAGILYGLWSKAFSFKMEKVDFLDFFTLEAAKKYAIPFLLLSVLILAFFIRLQPFSPIYSELDPYFYVYGTGQIIQQGEVPMHDDTAWWPEVQNSHRVAPLKMYIEAEWYSLYTQGGAYDNYLLFATSSWLPPICGALLAFGAYLFVSAIYGRKYGVFAAALMAFLPGTIFKMSAGVNEAAPVGIMMLLLTLGLFAYALVKKDRATRLLAALAFFVTVTGSNFLSVVALPFAIMLILQSIGNFMRGKEDRDLVLTGAYGFAGMAAGALMNGIYTPTFWGWVLYGPLVMGAVALAFAAGVYYLCTLKLEQRKKTGVMVAGVLFALLLLVTPLGNVAKKTAKDYLGAVEFNTALERTIAEQNLAGDSFEGEGGFAALVPNAHIVASPADAVATAMNLVYGALGAVATPFTLIGNLMLHLMDSVFNIILGTQIATTEKTNSILFIFMIAAVAGLLFQYFRHGDDEGRDKAAVALLLLVMIVPIMYVGMNKIKFTAYAGLMIALAAAIGLAVIELFLSWAAKSLKMKDVLDYLPGAFVIIMVLMAYAQAAGPIGYAKLFLVKSFEPRYQDNPAGTMASVEKLCNDLMQKGVPYSQIQGLCTAGTDPSYPSTINRQFDPNVCWLSLMKINELFPANDTASQRASADAVTGARIRCNRLGDYWVDSMDWINRNLDSADRVTSWWDYGHWINYLGERKTVLRNEHADRGMIGRVAHDYILGSTEDLVASMNYFDSRYALFDVELIGGSSFGGKYGALNYLGCVHEGQATLAQSPGTTLCEWEHSPERIMVAKVQVPQTTCVISQSQQRTGVLAYPMEMSGVDLQNPSYCVGDATIKTGEKISGTYYLNQTDANGDLVLSKGFMRVIDNTQEDAAIAEMVYNNQAVWPGANGTWVDGMEDAKTAFYSSNLYKAFYLEDLPGFDLVYSSANGEVKIYRMKDTLWAGNKEGKIDPVEAARQN